MYPQIGFKDSSDTDAVAMEDLAVVLRKSSRIRFKQQIVGAFLTYAVTVPLLHAQTIHGRVTDIDSGLPIPVVWVGILDTSGVTVASTLANREGRFQLTVPLAGAFRISIRAVGYRPLLEGLVGLLQGDSVDVEVVLLRQAMRLDPVEVRADSRVLYLETMGFYARRREGFGAFLDRDDIEKRSGARGVGDLLRAIPGVIVDSRGYVRLRGIGTFDNKCQGMPPTVWVDGMRIMARPVESGFYSENWHELLDPLDIEAIEVYRRPSEIPAQYGGSTSGCGVILIWLRHG